MNRRYILFSLVLLSALMPTCTSVPLTAPPGSSLTAFANPEFISANGGVSVISVLVMDPTGVPAADGTVVQFFTNLGRVDEQGKTNDGVARVNLVSDSRSGTATVTAVSGGAAVTPPAASPSPTTSAQEVSGVAFADGSSDTATVTIGNLNAQSVVLGADPPRIVLSVSRTTHVFATVLDSRGNPVAGAPVFFRIASDDSGAGQDEMQSAGRPIFTDNNGRAEDILRTHRTEPGTAKVDVQVPTDGGFVVVDPLSVPVV